MKKLTLLFIIMAVALATFAKGPKCDYAQEDFRIRYEWSGNVKFTYSEISVVNASVSSSYIQIHNGQPFPAITIKADAFNNVTPCYVLQNIQVKIDSYKKINGKWQVYRSGVHNLNDLFYYNTPVNWNGMRKITVNVNMQYLHALTHGDLM